MTDDTLISLTPDTIIQYEREGRPSVVRFRMPDTDITVHDSVLGDVTVKATELEDFINLIPYLQPRATPFRFVAWTVSQEARSRCSGS